MTDQQALKIVEQIIAGEDKESAGNMALLVAQAYSRQLAEAAARRMLTIGDAPKRSVTRVLKHDAKGRILAFEKEEMP
jgi:hypothetical protein